MSMQESTTSIEQRSQHIRRRRMVGGALAFTLASSGLAAFALSAPAVADSGRTCEIVPTGPWVSCSQTFDYTGTEQTWQVPDGVTEVDVFAVGAAGGDGTTVAPGVSRGGKGAVVDADGVDLPVGTDLLFIEVGGRGQGVGNSGSTAFNGGGSIPISNSSGGGGGASDVRTASRTSTDTLSSRLVVAGGGGGSGSGKGPISNGGDAGQPGETVILDSGWIVGGGGAGTQTAGGVGGVTTNGGVCSATSDVEGLPGTFGTGGAFNGDGSRGGGSGGGGWYGGGSGAYVNPLKSVSCDQITEFDVVTGGGGGSSYPADAAISVNSGGLPPSVTLSWREPATYTVATPATVGTNELFAASATLVSDSFPTIDVSSYTTFEILPAGAGTCSGPVCEVTQPGPVTVKGTYGLFTSSASVTVGTAASISGTLPAATINTPYSFAYMVGGDPASTVEVTAGTLPSGVTLSATGVLSGTPTAAGLFTFTVTADNGFGSPAVLESALQVQYVLTGFLSPVDAAPTVNTVKAGSAVPLRFSLGGDFGMNILSGTPSFVKTSCTGGEEDSVSTVVASNSGLQYDPTTGTYTYVWKTSKSDAGKCGQFRLTLSDGTTHTALFKLK